MKFIQYFSQYIVIFIVVFVVSYGIFEKKNVFGIFIEGVKNGERIALELIPTWLGLFVSIGMLKTSGIIDFLTDVVCKVFKGLVKYKDVLPLIFLRPISGSSSTAMGINIMKNVGVDSSLGLLISCIMGSTETTIYVVALYTSKLKEKNVKPVIIIGLIGDFLCICFSILSLKILKIVD